MPERKYSPSSGSGLYRYGFNGKENDNEVKGEGNQQDYGFRVYDPRIGKFLTVDPLTKEYPMFSAYQFAGNRPIVAIDLEGLEPQEHPYALKPINKPTLGVTNEGNVYEVYKVNSPSNGKTWIAKIYQKVEGKLNGFELKPIEHFMYHDNEKGWQYWQRADEQSIQFKQINQVANGIGGGFYGIIAAGAVAPALIPTVASLGTTRAISVGIDYGSQVGGNYLTGKRGIDAWTNINLSSLLVSAVNPTSSWRGLLANNLSSNALSYSATEGYNGFGTGKDIRTILLQTGLSTLAGKLTSRLDLGIDKLKIRLNHVEELQGGRSPLSISLQSMIRNYQARASAVGVATGVPSSGLNNTMENKKQP